MLAKSSRIRKALSIIPLFSLMFISLIPNISLSWEEIFPWFTSMVEALEGYSYPIWLAQVIFGWITVPFIIMIFLGYEPQLFPRPKIVKYRYKWSPKTVALFGILTAVIAVFYTIGGWIPIIPGIMSLFVFPWALLYIFPVVFGWPGLLAVVFGDLIGELLSGIFLPPYLLCLFKYNFFLGWLAWKTFGRDTSLRNLKSWGLWLANYLVMFGPPASFGWGAELVLFGFMPRPTMFILRSGFNILWYYCFIPLYPVLIVIIDSLARRYRLHWQLMEPQPYERKE